MKRLRTFLAPFIEKKILYNYKVTPIYDRSSNHIIKGIIKIMELTNAYRAIINILF